MKNLIIIMAILITLVWVSTAQAQTKVTKDAQGNYTVVKRDTAANKATGATIRTADGKMYPVYISVHGKLFYNRVSKAGNVYKVYIKED